MARWIHTNIVILTGLLALALNAFHLPAAAASSQSNRPAKVCIIGAGIAGASAAHFLSHEHCASSAKDGEASSQSRKQRVCDISIFEKSSKVGGRIASVALDDEGKILGEAGASIIHARNHLMVKFRKFLGLNVASDGDEVDSVGLYDGNHFVWETYGSFWEPLFFMMRYKMNLFRMRRFVGKLLSRFEGLYTGLGGGFETVESFLNRTGGLYNLTQQSLVETLREQKLSGIFVDELVTAIMRVNYNQKVSQMNGFSGAASLAGAGAGLWNVDGGNVLIPKGLIQESNATLFLNTTVSQILRSSDHTEKGVYELRFEKSKTKQRCDAVIIATPLELSSLSIPINSHQQKHHEREFQRTVATFVAGYLRPEYFRQESTDKSILPNAIYSIGSNYKNFSGVGRMPKNTTIPVHKVFSEEPITTLKLAEMFKSGYKVIKSFDWRAYPKYNPPEEFSRFQLDASKDGRIFYCNAIESVASAMEMSALAGQNVAALTAKALGLRYEYDREKDSGSRGDDVKEEL